MNECLLTIDFEDFKHDLKRFIGCKNLDGNPCGLKKSINVLNNILIKTNNATNATYFITGQVAKDYPDIVNLLSKSGNEIACHGNYHDMVFDMDREGFAKSLDTAILHLKNASGQDVKGFRAPSFSINKNCQWAFEEIAIRFLYDSSNLIDKKLMTPVQEYTYNNNHLFSLPIYNPVKFFNRRVRVIGGTFLKVLPLSIILSYLKEAIENGYLPIIYIHPYELLNEKEFWVSFKDMENISIKKKIYWNIRQNQWLGIGNKNFVKKLEKILTIYSHTGTISDYLKRNSYI